MRRLVILVLSIALAVASGCTSDSRIADVSGVVTLDGHPIENATITFAPKKGGSPSNARTSVDGVFRLRYTRSLAGAEVGEHIVKITTYRAANPDSDPPTPEVPERIPVNYNWSTELTADVKPGSNSVDFPLLSDRGKGRSNSKR